MGVLGKFKYLFLEIGFLGLFFVLTLSSIAGVIFPFAFSMMFALVWANQKIWLVCPAYLIASIVVDYSLSNIIGTVCSVFFLVVPYLIHYFCKKPLPVWELSIYCFLSQTASIVFSITSANVNSIYYAVTSCILGVLFMLGALTFLKQYLLGGLIIDYLP